MDKFFLHNDEYQRLYNCSFKTYDEWLKYGVKETTLGTLFLVLGTIYIILYIPILIVMTRPFLFKYSCWRIMFFNGILDCCSVIINSIIPGYLGILGVVPCNFMTFIYINGSVALGLWFCQCAICTVLGINRCIDFWRPAWMVDIFEGKRTLLWIGLSIGYGFLGFWFSNSPLYTSLGMGYFMDPYALIPMEEVPMPRNEYVAYFHSVNNISIVLILPLLHGFLIISVWWKSRGASGASFTKMQQQLFIQAFWICALTFAGSGTYVYIQFFPVPAFVVVVATMVWQGMTGGAVFIYYTLNRTIRTAVLRMICAPLPFGKFQVGPSATFPSVSRGNALSVGEVK